VPDAKSLSFGCVTELCLAGCWLARAKEINNIFIHPSHPTHQHHHHLALFLRKFSQRTQQARLTPTSRYRISIMPGLTSASGVLGFLSDEEPELKVFALQTLNDDIDTLWTEVAGSIGQM
jgi:hypothetical protein